MTALEQWFAMVRAVVSHFWPLILLAVLIHVVWLRRHPTGWPRLLARYPAVPIRANRRRFFASGLVVDRRFYRNAAWVAIDDGYLHVSGIGPLGLFMRRFSVPLGDISAAPDTFRWGPIFTQGVARLTFVREPGTPVMIEAGLYQKLARAGVGRLPAIEPGSRRAPEGTRSPGAAGRPGGTVVGRDRPA